MVDLKDKKISFLLPSLSTGGIARVMINLANHFAINGHNVDVLYCKNKVDLSYLVSENVSLLKIDRSKKWYSLLFFLKFDKNIFKRWAFPVFFSKKPNNLLFYIPNLTKYIKDNKPHCIISANTYANIINIVSKNISNINTHVIISEHTHLSTEIENKKDKSSWKMIKPLINKCYMKSNRIVTVSHGVSNDLIKNLNIPERKIITIYNPVISKKIFKMMREDIDHQWFNTNYKIILGVGRLEKQKDWPTLMRAFSCLLQYQKAKLIILGEGSLRDNLNKLALKLNIQNHFDMPGKVNNPYKYMYQSDVFVLSSYFEGLPTVLIEALACGCKIVSTDCPSGPSEILNDGQYGMLIQVKNHRVMSHAILTSFSKPHNAADIQRRAFDFSIEKSYHEYNTLIQNLNYVEDHE